MRQVVLVLGVVLVVYLAASYGPELVRKWRLDQALARCAQLRAQLAAVRVQGGDPVAAQRIEDELNACARDVAALGGTVDAAGVQLLACDTAYEQQVQEFSHYRSTEYSDAVKRNNTRQTILRLGDDQVRCYNGAIAAATSPATLNIIRASILRTLEAAVDRRNCYLYDQRGCGRFGVNEPHGNDKAADEQQRIIDPLVASYRRATARVGELGGSLADAGTYGTRDLGTVLEHECEGMNDEISRQWAHYKATEYSDAVTRNNTRQTILTLGAQAAACYQRLVDENRGNLRVLEGLRPALERAVVDSTDRFNCYVNDGPGCGRFGLNEDHGNDKGQQELDRVHNPLDVALRTLDAEIAEARAAAAASSPRFDVARVGLVTRQPFTVSLAG